MSESEKLCGRSSSEMSIKPGYTYATDLDCVDGFTTVKQDYKENPPFATQALVFMSRGIVKNWKQELSACRKLTQKHIEVSYLKKMNVKVAAQVLSHSVASALRLYVASKNIESNAIETTHFILKMDKLFDTVNSMTLKHEKNELCAVTKDSCHEGFGKIWCLGLKSAIYTHADGKKLFQLVRTDGL
ncbi:hypothetical protein AVEN_114386-1 [Araneus ventricosus]|uniref:Transposable element P transposase-like GTP-binding insertion domain-containing protein n=1 Tax=Araneus ventricosus TaxID=182803 RepID=A0A4Y2KM24_ARAVE|nr:hypothetical protein AVEN_114386-1 [Araneus ventricosus]